MESFDEHPIQTASAVAEAYGMHRTTLSTAFHRGALGASAYLSKGIILIDVRHSDFVKYRESYSHQPRSGGKIMTHFTVHGINRSNYSIYGDTLEKAVAENFRTIAENMQIGNAAGYRLQQVSCAYEKGILGGQGGAVLVIKWKGMDLAHKPASEEVQTTIAWIHATPEDVPEPFTISLSPHRSRANIYDSCSEEPASEAMLSNSNS